MIASAIRQQPDTVDVEAELTAIRQLLRNLQIPDRGKLEKALQDATEETAKANPDKEDGAGAIRRIIKYARAADDFGEHAGRLFPHVAAVGSWLGEHGRMLLGLFGATP